MRSLTTSCLIKLYRTSHHELSNYSPTEFASGPGSTGSRTKQTIITYLTSASWYNLYSWGTLSSVAYSSLTYCDIGSEIMSIPLEKILSIVLDNSPFPELQKYDRQKRTTMVF